MYVGFVCLMESVSGSKILGGRVFFVNGGGSASSCCLSCTWARYASAVSEHLIESELLLYRMASMVLYKFHVVVLGSISSCAAAQAQGSR